MSHVEGLAHGEEDERHLHGLARTATATTLAIRSLSWPGESLIRGHLSFHGPFQGRPIDTSRERSRPVFYRMVVDSGWGMSPSGVRPGSAAALSRGPVEREVMSPACKGSETLEALALRSMWST